MGNGQWAMGNGMSPPFPSSPCPLARSPIETHTLFFLSTYLNKKLQT